MECVSCTKQILKTIQNVALFTQFSQFYYRFVQANSDCLKQTNVEQRKRKEDSDTELTIKSMKVFKVIFKYDVCVERNMHRAHFHSQISHENSFIYLTKKNHIPCFGHFSASFCEIQDFVVNVHQIFLISF